MIDDEDIDGGMDDDDDVSVTSQYRIDPDGDTVIDAELKHTLRVMIRTAIREQNKQVLFTCRHCCFYSPPHAKSGRPAKCGLDADNQLITAKRMPTQLPDCFNYDPLASRSAVVLGLLYELGIDVIHAKHGWATVVGRLAARQDRYGYITGIAQKNLKRYGEG